MVITESMEDLRRRDEDEALEQEAARLENELGANAGPSAEETKTTVNSDEQAPHQTEISQVGIAEAEPEPEFEPDAEGGMDEVSNEPTLDDSMASFSPGGKEIILDPKSGVFPMKFENEEIRFAVWSRASKQSEALLSFPRYSNGSCSLSDDVYLTPQSPTFIPPIIYLQPLPKRRSLKQHRMR